MPMATPSTGTPREDLLGAYTEYDPTKSGLIAREVLPILTVTKRVGDFGVKPLKAYTQRVDTKRAPNGRTSRGDWTPESRSFALQEYSNEHAIDKVTQGIYEDWFDAEEEASVMTHQAVDRDYEYEVAEKLFNRTLMAADDQVGHDVVTRWSDPNSNPLLDVSDAKKRRKVEGVTLDTMVLPQELAYLLPHNNVILERVKYLFPGVVDSEWDAEVFQRLFSIPRVLIANGQADTASPELDASLSEIWSPNFVGLYSTSSGMLNSKPCIGRTFEQSDSSGVAIYSYEEHQTKSTVVGSELHADANIIHDRAGYLLGGTMS